MDDLKLCRDCKWMMPRKDFISRVLGVGLISAKCGCPDAGMFGEINFVTGKDDRTHFHCSTMRVRVCGPAGRLWEAR
jgi:hypothetical protein